MKTIFVIKKTIEYFYNFSSVESRIYLNPAKTTKRKNNKTLAASASNGEESLNPCRRLSNVPSIKLLSKLRRFHIMLHRKIGKEN